MLGSFDAEDAVQETLLRAWRSFDHFEGRATLRSWLYRIATNVCLDTMRSRQRDAQRIEVMSSNLTRGPVEDGQGTATVVTAIPAGGVATAPSNPADTAVMREAVLLAFAVLMRLPPRQRAVLILRDVLRWRAREVAELLDTTVASVNSSLRRARSTLAARESGKIDHCSPRHVTDQELVDRCLDVFERYDVDVLITLLCDKADRLPGVAAKGVSDAA